MEHPVLKPRVSKVVICQVSSSHAKGTSGGSLLKNDSFLSVDIQNLIESRRKHPNNVLMCSLNINSLRYKVVDLRTLLSKFLFTTLFCTSRNKIRRRFSKLSVCYRSI